MTMDNRIVLSLPHRHGNARNSEGSFVALKDGRIMFAWTRYRGDSWADEAYWGRTPLVAAISKDEGRRWRHAKAIETDPDRGFCYIATHFTEDALLLAYCCGGRESVVLQDLCIRRVTWDWFCE